MSRTWGINFGRKQKAQGKQWIAEPWDRKTQWVDEADDWSDSEKVRKGRPCSNPPKEDQRTRRVCKENGVESQWVADIIGSIS
jgi:hypothetical protein